MICVHIEELYEEQNIPIYKLGKELNFSNNKSRELVDSVARNWTDELLLQDKYIDRTLSIYTDIGVRENYMSEVVAEAFSVRKTNSYAIELMSRLKGLMER